MNIDELLKLDTKEYGYLKSCILGIDAIVGGYAIGELTVLCAPTSGGKSLVSLDSALCMSEGLDVLYISCENSIAEDQKRIKNSIDKYNLDPGAMSFEYYNMDNTNIGLDELEEIIQNSYCDVVFVDSIDFLDVPADNGAAMYQNYGKVARALRMLGRKYEIAVITTAQVNRQGYDKEFMKLSVADMADSIKIARQAHDVWYIGRKDSWAMKVIKHRDQLRLEKEAFCMASSNIYTDLNITHAFGNSTLGIEFDYKIAKTKAED